MTTLRLQGGPFDGRSKPLAALKTYINPHYPKQFILVNDELYSLSGRISEKKEVVTVIIAVIYTHVKETHVRTQPS